MKKFFTITLILLVMAANAMAQDNKRQLLDQCKNQNIRLYGEYLLNPQSLDDETAVRLGCAILKDVLIIPRNLELEIGMIIAILKTMPADIKLQQAYGNKDIVYFDNGKVFISYYIRQYKFYEVLRNMGELDYDGHGVKPRTAGFLYNPSGESGFGTLIKAEDSKKDYFPKTLLTTKLERDDLKKDLGGDYVIGSGLLFNLQNINGTDLFFDCLDPNNEIEYDDTEFKEKLKLQKDPDYNVYAEFPMRPLYWSPSDKESYMSVGRAIVEKSDNAYRTKEVAKDKAMAAAAHSALWDPYKKKYGAAVVSRVEKGQVWIGMPVDLVEIYHRRVKKTQSFGGTVEIYVGNGKRIWVTNGKVSKIVSK